MALKRTTRTSLSARLSRYSRESPIIRGSKLFRSRRRATASVMGNCAVTVPGARDGCGVARSAVAARSRAVRISRALCQRSAGSFSRQRITTASSAEDTEGRREESGAGFWVRCMAATRAAVAAVKGGSPAIAS
jgi:hypothetical protein